LAGIVSKKSSLVHLAGFYLRRRGRSSVRVVLASRISSSIAPLQWVPLCAFALTVQSHPFPRSKGLTATPRSSHRSRHASTRALVQASPLATYDSPVADERSSPAPCNALKTLACLRRDCCNCSARRRRPRRRYDGQVDRYGQAWQRGVRTQGGTSGAFLRLRPLPNA
jgi:hypothetical protein